MIGTRILQQLFIIFFFTFSCAEFMVSQQNEKEMEHQTTFTNLKIREGNRPETTNTNPHTQLNQQPNDLTYVEALMDWAFTLQNITKEPSRISVPGSIAMCLEEDHTCDRCNAFMVGTEFAHFHPHPDYSMHLGLPTKDAQQMIDKGWGEWHPLIKRGYLPPNIVMLYAPRNQAELEASKLILQRSYDFAKGKVQP
ncbi:MAG: hypothetical protein AAF617_10370 [Bacteroidota bacterium]